MRKAARAECGSGEEPFTPVPNGLLEALARTRLTQYEIRVLLVILRKTTGFRKADDWIALRQFEVLSGIARAHVCRALRNLTGRNIVTRRGKRLAINQVWSQWREVPRWATGRSRLPIQVTAVASAGNGEEPSEAPTKETKDNITKESGGPKKTKSRQPRRHASVEADTDYYEEQRTFFVRQALAHQEVGKVIASIAKSMKQRVRDRAVKGELCENGEKCGRETGTSSPDTRGTSLPS